jgi:anti-sigma regulatory factor (Ser/Thr protein kinase)
LKHESVSPKVLGVDSAIPVAVIGAAATVAAAFITARIARRKRKRLEDEVIVLKRSIRTNDMVALAKAEHIVLKYLWQWNYDVGSMKACRAVLHELAQNAFQHGSTRVDASVQMKVEVSHAAVIVRFEHSSETSFDVADQLVIQKARLEENRESERGRGLILVEDFADEMKSDTPQSVTATLYRNRVILAARVDQASNIAIITVFAGVMNPSFKRRVVAAASRLGNRDLIIEFSGFKDSEEKDYSEEEIFGALRGESALVRLRETSRRRPEWNDWDSPAPSSARFGVVVQLAKRLGPRQVVVVGEEGHGGLLPPGMTASTVGDAIALIVREGRGWND